jgi:hypothetical protein
METSFFQPPVLATGHQLLIKNSSYMFTMAASNII